MIELEELIKWLKENYETVELFPPLYRMKGDYSDVVDRCICFTKKSPNISHEYHKRYAVSIEQLCEDIKSNFKDK